MNKNFERTKIGNGFLVSDADLDIKVAFYPPNFDSVTDLNIGNNDPDKVGAIASKIIDGESKLFIYQGGDLWKPIASGTIKKQIAPWTIEATEKDEYRSHVIDDIEYLFRSEEDGNITEPSFEESSTWTLVGVKNAIPFDEAKLPKEWSAIPTPLDAIRWTNISGVNYEFSSTIEGNTSQPSFSETGSWNKTEKFGLVTSWSSGTTYAIETWVTGDFNSKVYRSKINGNIGNAPSGGVSNSFWEFIGDYRGVWQSFELYNLNDVVVDSTDSNRRYISAKDNNEAPLSDIVTSGTWKLLGVKIDDSITSTSSTWSSSKTSSSLDLKIPLTQKGVANGLATLGSDGKVPNNQVPALAISETFPVSSQAEMLALSTADQGDVAIRSDISKSFILRQSPSSTLANWSELLSPTDSVTSVFGRVGVVSAEVGDYSSFYALKDGSNAHGNWFINAATATQADETVLWNGYQNRFADAISGSTIDAIAGQHNDGMFYRFNAPAVRTFIGGGTISTDITGNAVMWNAQLYDNTSGSQAVPNYLMGLNSTTGKWTYQDANALRSFLGSPSGGETLPSVMDRGHIITNNKQITYQSNSDDIVAFNNAAGSLQGYVGKISSGGAQGMYIYNGASTKSLQLLNSGDLIYNGPIKWGTGTSTAGTIVNTATLGTVLATATGSLYDYILANGAGNTVMAVPTGTVNTTFAGNITSSGTAPYLNLTPSVWSGTTYIQAGIDVTGSSVGDYTNIQNPIGKGLAYSENGVPKFVIAPGGNATFSGNITTPGVITTSQINGGSGDFFLNYTGGSGKTFLGANGNVVIENTGNLTAPTATIGNTTIGGNTSNIQGTSTATFIRPTSGTAGGLITFQDPTGTTDFGSIGISGWVGGAVLTGLPTAPTATAGTNTTQIATTAYVDGATTSGGYTPTLTVSANATSSSNITASHYSKTGNRVTVYGSLIITPSSGISAGTNTVVKISLPISSNLADGNDLIGHGSARYNSGGNNVSYSSEILCDPTNDSASVSVFAYNTNNITVYYSFTYIVK